MPTSTEPPFDPTKVNPASLEGHLYGLAPVQGEGTLGGQPWYFRARGNYWSFELEAGAKDEQEVDLYFFVGQEYKPGEPYAASYMPEEEAWEYINLAVSRITSGEVQAEPLRLGHPRAGPRLGLQWLCLQWASSFG